MVYWIIIFMVLLNLFVVVFFVLVVCLGLVSYILIFCGFWKVDRYLNIGLFCGVYFLFFVGCLYGFDYVMWCVGGKVFFGVELVVEIGKNK